MITVRPANTTADPAVLAADPAASCGSRPQARSSRRGDDEQGVVDADRQPSISPSDWAVEDRPRALPRVMVRDRLSPTPTAAVSSGGQRAELDEQHDRGGRTLTI